MPECYFEITKESPHYSEWFDYREAFKKMKIDVRAFAKKHKINIDEYNIFCGKLWVDPVANKEFSEQFCKERGRNGFAPFKKTSYIGREFTKSGIKIASKPFVPFFFNISYGQSTFREFDFEGKVYCQYNYEYDPECPEVNTPKGFIPMKASEFYAIIERIEEKEKNNE